MLTGCVVRHITVLGQKISSGAKELTRNATRSTKKNNNNNNKNKNLYRRKRLSRKHVVFREVLHKIKVQNKYSRIKEYMLQE